MSLEPPGGPQQRRFFRAAVEFPVTIHVPKEELLLDGTTVDLSGGGMRIIAKQDLAAGRDITLRFKLPGKEREMMLRARVVLSFYDAAKQQFAHGVAFTQIAAADQSEIVEYVHELQRRARA